VLLRLVMSWWVRAEVRPEEALQQIGAATAAAGMVGGA